MNATIITIGDEIVIGQITDTNSQYIASKLGAIGFKIEAMISVRDNLSQMKKVIVEAMNQSQLVVTTGGLGPTKDDITKELFCQLFECNLKLHQPTYDQVEEMLNRRGIEFNSLNQGQAYLPEACRVIKNEFGTAPGMWFEHAGGVIVSLPGVPFEMKKLIDNQIIEKIQERFKLPQNFHKTALTYGIPESLLAQTLTEWEDSLPQYLSLAYLPSENGVRLRLSAYGVEKENENGVQNEIDAQFLRVEEIIGNNFVGYGSDLTLEKSVADLLSERGETLACAESCSGGKLSSRFTAMEGSSAYFLGSVVSYSNSVKMALLDVKEKSLESYGAVSEQVAKEMAKGAREKCGSNYAISTTGIAGPGGGSEEKPVGTVWIGFASKEKNFAVKVIAGKLRNVNIDRFSSAAIDILRRELLY